MEDGGSQQTNGTFQEPNVRTVSTYHYGKMETWAGRLTKKKITGMNEYGKKKCRM